MLFCSVNGVETSQLSCLDRGLAFGDGVFTTAKISAGNVIDLAAHLARLHDSCQALYLVEPDMQKLAGYVQGLAERFSSAVLKIIITSGVGGRGYSRAESISPTVIVIISSFPAHYIQWQQRGIMLGISQQHLGIYPMLAGIKHLNRLEQVLIKRELDASQFDDLLVCNAAQQIVETSCANVFWWQDEQLCTPAIEHSGVNGLYRQKILHKVPNISIVSSPLSTLMNISAMFICNSLMEIVPVAQFNGASLDVAKVIQFKEQLQC